MARLLGCDISQHQCKNFVIENAADNDFFIIKATEGKNWVDPKWKEHAANAEKCGKLLGFYHFCRPDNRPTEDGARDEAAHFVNTVKDYVGRAIFCLDWEMKAWNYPLLWARAWCDEVYRLTGVRPLMYCHRKRTAQCKDVASGNYGLWCVHWGSNTGKVPNEDYVTTGAWNVWALWQWTSKPYDRDYFNGDKETWMKYAAADKEDENEPHEDGEGVCGVEWHKELEEFLAKQGFSKPQ